MSSREQTPKNTIEGMTQWQILAFSAPTIGLSFLVGPKGVIQGVYAKHFGFSLTVSRVKPFFSQVFIDPSRFADLFASLSADQHPLS